MSASDRECNSEGERLHNTRQRAAELRGRSDHEQSQGEECDQGAESDFAGRGDDTDHESGRAGLAAARATVEDPEDYTEGIENLYGTSGEQQSGDHEPDRAGDCHAHYHSGTNYEADTTREDHVAEQRRIGEPGGAQVQHGGGDDRQTQRGEAGNGEIVTDASNRQREDVSHDMTRAESEPGERPSTWERVTPRLTEAANSRGRGRKSKSSRGSRGNRNLSPLLLTHEGQEFTVKQPFKARSHGRGKYPPREGEIVMCGSWAKRDVSPDTGMGETLYRTMEVENAPGRRRVVEVIRQTKQEEHDRKQYGLHMAHSLAVAGIRKGRESRDTKSPTGRSSSKSRPAGPPDGEKGLDTRNPFVSHMAHQQALVAARKGDESTADDETDDDVWYDTGENQLHGVPIDWDEKRQEPVGEFDLAYCSVQRENYEHRMWEELDAKEEYLSHESDHRRPRGELHPTEKRNPRENSDVREERGIRALSTEASRDGSAGQAQGSVVHSPEGFTKGLNRAIRQTKGETNRARGVSLDPETRRANDYWDKHYWSKRQIPGPRNKEEPEHDPARLRQLLYRMNDREDTFQDEKDRGVGRSRHPAGRSTNGKNQSTGNFTDQSTGNSGIVQKRDRDRGDGDAGQRRPAVLLSNSDTAWLKRTTAGSSLARLQQRCVERGTKQEHTETAPDTYFKHERAPLRSSPVNVEEAGLTAELIGYIEAQEVRMGKLEERVRTSQQSSPRMKDEEDPLAGARRFLQARVATGRQEEQYASGIEQEASGRPRRSVRIQEQGGNRESSDNAYGKTVEREIRRQHRKKLAADESKAARRKREFLAKVAAYEAETTEEETEADVPYPSPVIQMRTNGPITKVKPPSFDGTMFLAFEQQFEAACRCSGYDEAARVELLRCSLRGPARQLLLNTGADSWTYAQLMEALRTRHGKTRSKTEVRNALRAMYKKPGQKALDFADEIDWVASQAEFTPKELTTATYEAFWHGLRTTPRQQKYVEKHDTTQTLKMAAEIAARWERTKGTTEDTYVPQESSPVDWAMIQARQAVNAGAPVTGGYNPAAAGAGHMIASAMSNEALLRQEEKDRETKRKGAGADPAVTGRTLAELQATLDDLSSDHAVLKSSIIRERQQRNQNNNNRGRGGFRFGAGRGGGQGRRGPPHDFQQDRGPGLQNQQGESNQA